MGVKIREKDGAWWVFITHKGRRKAKRIGHYKTAEAVAQRIRAKLVLDEWPEDEKKPQPKPTCPTVREYAANWLALYCETTLKPSTVTGYRLAFNRFILPAFGDKRLNELKRAEIKDFALRLQAKQGIKPKTARNVSFAFNAMLTHALDDEIIEQHPMKSIGKLFKGAGRPSEINPLSSEEVSRLLVTAKEHYPGDYPLFALLGLTGMRIGEALALQWGDLQFGKDENDPNRYIRIERGWVLNAYTTTKTGRSRNVDMNRTLREVLLEYREKKAAEAVLKGKTLAPSTPAFPGPDGRPRDKSWVWNKLQSCLGKAGLRRIRVHDLRHSFATIMLYELHAPIQYVSEQLGHASITMTVNRYGHPRQGTGMTFADTMGGAIRNESDPEICNLSATKDRFQPQVIENMVSPTGFEPVLPP